MSWMKNKIKQRQKYIITDLEWIIKIEFNTIFVKYIDESRRVSYISNRLSFLLGVSFLFNFLL